MDFESACKYLESFVSYEDMVDFKYDEKNFNLGRFRKFISELGIDYSGVKFVHVAGSKGKGSVCGLVASYLKEAPARATPAGAGGSSTGQVGGRVGLFTSPHLIDVRERIVVDGEMISQERFAEYVEKLKEYLDLGAEKVTYFELLTAIAFRYFVDSGVEYAVLEVGLGGRLDSTNIVVPELAILTCVELEHTDVLGDTLSEILDEKLGIVKDGVPLLVGPQSKEGMDLLKQKLRRNVEVFFVEDYIQFSINNYQLSIEGDQARVENAKTAYCALKILLDGVDETLFRHVFEEFRLPGRFDVRKIDGKTVVFDVAHTKNSIRNLVHSLVKSFTGQKFTFLVSLLRGKDVEGVLEVIGDVAEKIVFTNSHEKRGIPAEELAKLGGDLGCKVLVEEDCSTGYEKLLKNLEKDRVLVITGSHFLVGKILK